MDAKYQYHQSEKRDLFSTHTLRAFDKQNHRAFQYYYIENPQNLS